MKDCYAHSETLGCRLENFGGDCECTDQSPQDEIVSLRHRISELSREAARVGPLTIEAACLRTANEILVTAIHRAVDYQVDETGELLDDAEAIDQSNAALLEALEKARELSATTQEYLDLGKDIGPWLLRQTLEKIRKEEKARRILSDILKEDWILLKADQDRLLQQVRDALDALETEQMDPAGPAGLEEINAFLEWLEAGFGGMFNGPEDAYRQIEQKLLSLKREGEKT